MLNEPARNARRRLTDAIGWLLDLHQLTRPGEPPSPHRITRIDIIADGMIVVKTAEPGGIEHELCVRITVGKNR
jgi:hypothetical protein